MQPGDRHRILAVDDDHETLELILHGLQDEYDVVTLCDPVDTFEVIDAFQPDLLILDVMMPHISGFQLVEMLRRSEGTRTLPVMLLSAKSGAGEVKHGYKLGATLYLTKPFAIERLRRNVDAQFRLHHAASARRHRDANGIAHRLELTNAHRRGHLRLSRGLAPDRRHIDARGSIERRLRRETPDPDMAASAGEVPETQAETLTVDPRHHAPAVADTRIIPPPWWAQHPESGAAPSFDGPTRGFARGRYDLLEELGRGSSGIVYRALDRELDEIVALKFLPDGLLRNPDAIRRFRIEARNARRLSHPNIVNIHDIGEDDGHRYISMEYVDGVDLRARLHGFPGRTPPLGLALRYGCQIADALGHAHDLGIIHRDIKPANVMLSRADDAKVTDFGLAKAMDSGGEGTMMGTVIGTPLYMSPEQVQGLPADPRSDIYSLGVLLYEMLNGSTPFPTEDLVFHHLNTVPRPIAGLPAPLWSVVERCLAKRREDRWQDAHQLHAALRDHMRGLD